MAVQLVNKDPTKDVLKDSQWSNIDQQHVCKGFSEGCSKGYPKRAKISWTENEDSANYILQEMGVSFLNTESSNSTSQDSVIEPTPPSFYNNENIPPLQASALGSQSSAYTSCSSPDSLLNDFNTSLGFRPRGSAILGPDLINRLCDEIILAIFDWLPKFTLVKCARVCKRWNRLAFDETFWRRIDLSKRHLGPGVLGKVLDSGVSVLRLSKSEICGPMFLDFAHSMLFDSEDKFCNVQYLDLSMAVISEMLLEELLSVCMNLRKLSIENCQMSEQALRNLGNNTELAVVNLCMCTGITASSLVPLTTNCRRLQALNIAWTNLDREAIVYLVLCLPNGLTKLNISGCRENLIDEDIKRLVHTCPHLKELDLSDATKITSDILPEIVENLRGLEYIALSRCYHILPTSLIVLKQIVTLIALDVFGTLREPALQRLREEIPCVQINTFPFSNIARPTTGIRRTRIWGIRTRDNIV